MLEHETFPKSQTVREQLRPATREHLRLKYGNEESMRAALDKAVKSHTAFAAECPTVARRAAETGCAEHPEVIELFANHPDPVSSKE